MSLAKKTSNVLTLILLGLLLVSCSSNQAVETVKPISAVPTSATKTVTPKEEAFNNYLNDLIKQLGDYDYKKQESAQREILGLADTLTKAITANLDIDSPELDYIISALEYASKNGRPPSSETKTRIDAAVQIRAEKLYAAVKYSGIIHPDLIKLYPEITALMQKGEVRAIMDWLAGQSQDIKIKGIRFYGYALKSPTSAVRQDAIKGLIKLGGVKYVLPLLEDKSTAIRIEVTDTLLKLEGVAVIKDMMPLLKGDDYLVSTVCSFIYKLQNKSDVDALLPLLKSEHANIRQAMVDRVRKWEGADAAKHLIPLLKDNSVEVRRDVVMFLSDNTSAIDKSLIDIKDILTLLDDPDDGIRWMGFLMLPQLAGKSITKYLIPLLKHSDPQIRTNSIRLLMGQNNKIIIPEILPLLDDNDSQVRLSVIESLAYFGGDEIINKYSLMDKLSAIAHGREQHIKFRAIEVAIGIGQGKVLEKYGLIDELVNLMDNGDEWHKTRSITIAGKYGPPSIVKKILPFLKDKDLRIKLSAAWALSQQGDIRAVPVWIEHIDDECNVAILHDNRLADTGLTSIIYVAEDSLRKLTGQAFDERRNAKLWKDWWAKEGKAWYDEEVKKIKDE